MCTTARVCVWDGESTALAQSHTPSAPRLHQCSGQTPRPLTCGIASRSHSVNTNSHTQASRQRHRHTQKHTQKVAHTHSHTHTHTFSSATSFITSSAICVQVNVGRCVVACCHHFRIFWTKSDMPGCPHAALSRTLTRSHTYTPFSARHSGT